MIGRASNRQENKKMMWKILVATIGPEDRKRGENGKRTSGTIGDIVLSSLVSCATVCLLYTLHNSHLAVWRRSVYYHSYYYCSPIFFSTPSQSLRRGKKKCLPLIVISLLFFEATEALRLFVYWLQTATASFSDGSS